MSKAQRIAYVCLAVVMACLLGVCLVLGIAWGRDAKATVASRTQEPTSPRIGEVVTVSAVVRMPWHRRPTAEPVVELAEGLNLLPAGEPTMIDYGFGTIDWQVQLKVIPVDFGPFAASSASLPLTPQRDSGDDSLIIAIDEIRPASRYQADEEAAINFAGALAAPVAPPSVPPRWPWAVVAVLSLGLLVFVLLRRRRQADAGANLPPPPPPWETAQRELAALEAALPMAADRFFVRLVDLLRQYLENAFHLPATEQTTVEFLQAMQASPDLLSADHRALLEEVISAADFVKFARTDASDEQMNAALGKARSFVVESAEPLRQKPNDGLTGDV